MRLLPIVAVQGAPVAWDVEATWDKFERETTELRATFPETRLFLYPELYLSALGPVSGRAVPGAASRAVAEPIPGPLTERLGALARDLGVWLVPGSFYELGEGGRVFNTAVAVS